MPPRFFCPQPLLAGRALDLPAHAAHHATRVLRLGIGDELVLFDGSGGEWFGRIGALGGGSVRVVLSEYEPASRESPLRTVLAQALLASEKMDWLVQKAVELGVNHLVPLEAERAVVRLRGDRANRRAEHLRQVAIAACEQCGRNVVPEVAPLTRWTDFLAGQRGGAAGAARLILAPGSKRSLRDLAPDTREIVLLVGPEGGWTEPELKAAEATGFLSVGLGPRILRAESAGIAALAAVQMAAGDF